MLTVLIKQYFAAQAAWREKSAVDDSDENTQAQWDAYVAAEDAVFRFPCGSLEDVVEKARFVLSSDISLDTLRLGSDSEGEYCLVPFLQSLIGEAVDKSNSGEN